MVHRDFKKLKIGVDVSWSGKHRKERGRGTVLAIGSADQCQSTKKIIEESSSNSKSVHDAPKAHSKQCLSSNSSNSENSNSYHQSLSVTKPATLAESAATPSSISLKSKAAPTQRLNTSNQLSSPKALISSKDSNCESTLFIHEDLFESNALVIDEGNNSEEYDLHDQENGAKADDEHSNFIDIVGRKVDTIVASDRMNKNKRTIDRLDEEVIPAASNLIKDRQPEIKKKKISRSMYNTLLQEKNSLAKQVKLYKSTWMPRPTDAKIIKFFIEIGRLLSGESDDDTMNNESDKGDLFARYCEALEVDPDEVEECTNTDSITKACRLLVSKLVPKHERINSSWKLISPRKRRAILGIAKMFHPGERKTNGELVKACRNVFEVAKSSLRKREQVIEQNDDSSSGDGEN